MDVTRKDGAEMAVDRREYRVFTPEYTTHSTKIFIDY
jgi:hypothetical protein